MLRRPSSVGGRRPPFTISKIFSSETTRPIKAKLHVEHPYEGGTKVCINGQGHMTTKTFENLLLQNQKAYDFETWHEASGNGALQKGTSRQRSGKGAIRKRFPLQKPRWEKTKLTIRYLYHETYRKPNEQLFSQ